MIIIDRITRWQVDYWSSLYVGSLSFRRCIVIVNRMLHICWSLCYSDRRKTSRNTYLTFFVRNCEFGILDRQKNLVKFFILFLVIFSKTEKNFEKKILEHGYNSICCLQKCFCAKYIKIPIFYDIGLAEVISFATWTVLVVVSSLISSLENFHVVFEPKNWQALHWLSNEWRIEMRFPLKKKKSKKQL